MRNHYVCFILVLFATNAISLKAQEIKPVQHPTLILSSENMVEIPSIAAQIADGTFQAAENVSKEFNPKKSGKNTSVPGKGLPKGVDPLWQKQKSVMLSPGKAPTLTFESASSGSTPTDPTGAVGPNHYVNAWNSSFRIWDKAGNPLTAPAALGTILNGNAGDPIVMYDRFADRFIITEFYSNGFGIAVGQGPDPVNDGWYLYQFNTSSFPDYPKFSVWSDGYYITSNKDSGSAGTSEVVFATDRTKMLAGNTSAQMIGFPLTGIVTSGFYSPLGFNANGSTLPPPGDAPIVYMQDDAWAGVSSDHLKIWKVNVNWTSPASSTISSPQIIATAPFDGLFDGGSFSNLPQPSGSDVDALQATIMYMAQYRRFASYNSVVFNFVVDLDGNDNYSGIRWYELRQTNDGDPWAIYQEGTYAQPNGHSAFCGNMCMDASGNIALAYTTVSSTQFPSLRYTGRHPGDPLGTMTIAEEVIGNGTQSDPSSRYGDYAQMTIDPTDDATFWSTGEFFNGGTRKNQVGVFQIAPPALTADFSANPTQVCAGSSTTYTDQSLGTPTSWSWTFPGGSPASFSGQNPPAISYAVSGMYDVSLTVSDGSNFDTQTKTNYINVQNVIADFSGTPTTVVVGNAVTFTDLSSCTPTSWSWSFPGGSPANYSGQNPPAITYATEGTYDVSLTVSNASGSDTKTLTGYITVISPEFLMQNGSITTCQGNFYDTGGATAGYSNNENITETFYPSTSGAMIRFNFSSFSTETGFDYLYIYDGINTSAPLIGTYNGTTGPGTVTASNATGALTFKFTSDASVTSSGWIASISCYSTTLPPVADFTADVLSPVIGQTVSFTDQSSNGPTSWAWSFSGPGNANYVGGTSSTSQNPQVQFDALGTYNASLTATNAYGSNSLTKPSYINVVNCTYCASSGTTFNEEWISNVTFGTINNSTPSAPAAGYSDFTSQSADVNPGSTYTASVSCASIGSWTENIFIFIDWNQNCDFTDAGESYDLGQTTGPGVLTLNIAVPSGALPGATRMRTSLKYSTNPTSCEVFSFGEVEDYTVNVAGGPFEVQLTAMLEGPFNGSTMDALLGVQLPLVQPYFTAPWNYPGTESVAAIPANVVDWVLVELRDAASAATATPATMVARQAAFILNDGSIVGMDGTSNLNFGVSITQGLYAVVWHRNHLSILSNNALTNSGGVFVYDYTTGVNQVYGGINGHKQLVSGVWGMFSGDGNSNGSVESGDKSSLWNNEAGNAGYIFSDYNLDTQSNNTDKDNYWEPNLGKGSQVPN